MELLEHRRGPQDEPARPHHPRQIPQRDERLRDVLEHERANDQIEGVRLNAQTVGVTEVAPVVAGAISVLVTAGKPHEGLVRVRLGVREHVEPSAMALVEARENEGLVPLEAPGQWPVTDNVPRDEREHRELPPVHLQRVRYRHKPVQLLPEHRANRASAGGGLVLADHGFVVQDHLPVVEVRTHREGTASLQMGPCQRVPLLEKDRVAQRQVTSAVKQQKQPRVELARALLAGCAPHLLA
mmetsp:Transcript_106825/g.300321  ORF Transcript_106825/g.300321 Transcript_106825/m.300321 type:complete len:241 (-) Transcript_106825:1002-1724(-)